MDGRCFFNAGSDFVSDCYVDRGGEKEHSILNLCVAQFSPFRAEIGNEMLMKGKIISSRSRDINKTED